MNNLTAFSIAIVSIPYLWFALIAYMPKATADEHPIAIVEIVEAEIEIEYVDTDVWSQWVFDTDSGVGYLDLRE